MTAKMRKVVKRAMGTGTAMRPLVYFENPTPGRAVPSNAVMKKLADNDEVLPTQIPSVCDQLEVDPVEFGFNYP